MSNGASLRRAVRWLRCGVATCAFVGITALGAVAAAAPADTAPPATVPADPTTPPVSEPTVTTPAETPEPTDVSPDTELDDTGFTDTGFDDDNTDVSAWWWIAGIVVAVAAVIGVVVAVRLRDTTERWAQRASLLCDSARAMSHTLSTRLADPAPWSMPARYAEQHQRCAGYLTELSGSAPDDKADTLLAAVAADMQELHRSLTDLAIGSPTEAARATVQPGLDRLSVSLGALEELATGLAMNAALPSSRSAH